MKQFKDKVAVVTGGASGIGYAFAERAVQEGMKVVIADVRPAALAEAEKKLKACGGDVLAVVTDVTKYEQVQALAKKTLDAFGQANIIFNNAGVFCSGVAWETSVELYKWVIDSDLMSVIYGIKAFVPQMIQQGDECHVVNVASGAGIITSPGFSTYSTTKHAVVALSDVLAHDLATHQIKNVGVTVVMPGYVQSDVMNPDKMAPNKAIADELALRLHDPVNNGVEAGMRAGVEAGMPALQAADMVFRAIREGQQYVLPNMEPLTEYAKAVGFCRATGQNPPALG